MHIDESRRTKAIVRGAERMRGASCRVCSRPICGHEAVAGIALGYGNAPHCLGCLAQGLGRDREAVRDSLRDYVLERECYKAGWLSASEREGFGYALTPACLWPAGNDALTDAAPGEGPVPDKVKRRPPAVEWDAGDSGCGDLVMELRMRLNAMSPGELLKLTARDPGAREDLPAWCRLTGHELVEGVPPTYLIRRRGD